ncbi:sugar phosphate isomerase/epimerase family protein [Tundrisphaera lichenicola]|uniref:sugar phosphate isomerase/epimerase family protein n=1 Tax=Tundrisphaera lichenicola TaxID=2029860 RepID=UPI003EBCA53E
MFASFNARAVGLMGLSAEETIDLAASSGFEGVDLLIRDLLRSGSNPNSIRTMMDDRGLRGGAFPMAVDWRGDESNFRRDLDDLPRLAEAAAILGLTRTGTWVMPETPHRSADRGELASLHIRRIGEIARILDDHGIDLGLEVIGVESFRTGSGEPFITRLSDLDRELEPIWAESPNLGILLDAFHLHAAGEEIEAGLSWGIGRVVWAHVADLPASALDDRSRIVDADRGLPGENGAVDVRGFLDRLAIEGYQGPVTVEPMSGCRSLAGLSPREIADRVRSALDGVWPEGRGLNRSSRSVP